MIGEKDSAEVGLGWPFLETVAGPHHPAATLLHRGRDGGFGYSIVGSMRTHHDVPFGALVNLVVHIAPSGDTSRWYPYSARTRACYDGYSALRDSE